MSHPPARNPREHAFTIVEVVIAAFVLAIVIAGATMVFGGASKSMSVNRLRDVESSLGHKALSILQADTTWATSCHSDDIPFTQANARCDVTTWLVGKHPSLKTVHESGQVLAFDVRAVATGIDLATDLTGAADRDGLRPDVYQVEVTVTPTAELAARFDTLRPFTVRAELNPSSRVTSGRITVDVCIASNQSDERLPIATCVGQAYDAKMLPPGGLDMSSRQRTASTCDGPESARSGADERDCVAFKCADPDIAVGSGVGCESMPGWRQPSSWSAIQRLMTSISLRPGSGTITLRSRQDGSTHGPVALVGGRAEFEDLPIGEFDITASIAGGYVPWRSKSVPSSNIVASEPGLNSRAVLVYRPPPTGAVTIAVSSLDITVPWEPVEYTGWPQIDNDRNLTNPNTPVKLCLVPAPQGRLVDGDVPCIEVPRSSATTVFPFTNVQPGLYAAYIADEDYVSFKPLSNHGGFIYIPASGPAVTAHGPVTGPIEYVESMCARNVRDGMVGSINPETGQPVEACSSPSGPPPPGGGGGGGSQ